MVWIYGASGHGKVILDILETRQIAVEGFLDDDDSLTEFEGYKVIRPATVQGMRADLIIAVGKNATRKKIAGNGTFNYITVIHPSAIISSGASIGNGTVIMAGSVIQRGSKIGKHTIINTGALIDHDCILGDYTHISPGATLCGNVTVGGGTWVGAGSTIIQGITIGSNVIIGAGSLILKDVPDNVLIVGNPQRIVRNLLDEHDH